MCGGDGGVASVNVVLLVNGAVSDRFRSERGVVTGVAIVGDGGIVLDSSS